MNNKLKIEILCKVWYNLYSGEKSKFEKIPKKTRGGKNKMRFKEVGISTARIKGLKEEPYWFEHHCFWAWGINFEEASYLGFLNLSTIYLDEEEEKAEDVCNKFKMAFKEAWIHDGDRVAVMHDRNGNIMAIGRIGADKWVDVKDKFVCRTFKDMNVVITSLKIH